MDGETQTYKEEKEVFNVQKAELSVNGQKHLPDGDYLSNPGSQEKEKNKMYIIKSKRFAKDFVYTRKGWVHKKDLWQIKISEVVYNKVEDLPKEIKGSSLVGRYSADGTTHFYLDEELKETEEVIKIL